MQPFYGSRIELISGLVGVVFLRRHVIYACNLFLLFYHSIVCYGIIRARHVIHIFCRSTFLG